jgi:flagellar basal-body rod modification protein FlgD
MMHVTPATYEEYQAMKKESIRGGDGDDMGQQDFLNLLVAQMKNQDPLSPMENAEFTAQTTAFSQLEQMINMNKTLTTMMEAQQSDTTLDETLMNSSSFIGKVIEYSTNTLSVSDAGISPISFYASDAASNATVKIYNEEGNLVATRTIDRVMRGNNNLVWDGTGDSGVKLGEGMYYFEVSGTTLSGDQLTTSSYGEGEVLGVSMSEGKLYFELAHGLVPADYIYGVKQKPQDVVAE